MSKGAQGIEEENFWAELVCRLKVCRRRMSRLFHITSNGEDDPTNPGGSSVRLESHIEALASFGYVMRGERHYEETYKGQCSIKTLKLLIPTLGLAYFVQAELQTGRYIEINVPNSRSRGLCDVRIVNVPKGSGVQRHISPKVEGENACKLGDSQDQLMSITNHSHELFLEISKLGMCKILS